jgi:TRAP-type C4-dicarboxylate transport system permease small subunit
MSSETRRDGTVPRSLPWIDAVSGGVSVTLACLAAVGTIGAMVVLLVDVAMRTLTGNSVGGAYETVQASVVLITYFALPYCERSGQSVRVSLLTDALQKRPALLLRQFGRLSAFAVAGWLAYATGMAAMDSIDRGEYSTGLVDFQVWPIKTAIAVGFAALCLELASQWLRGLLELNGPKSEALATPSETAQPDEEKVR